MKNEKLTPAPLTATSTQSRSNQQKDDDVLKLLEQTADRLKQAETERDSLKAQIELYKQMLSVKDEQIASLKEQSEFWKNASKTGDKIDTNNAVIVQMLRDQHAADLEEILRLRNENDKLRHSRDIRTIFGLGAGIAIGAAAGR